MHLEAYPLGAAQRHAAVFEGNDTERSILIAAERMWSEAHSELDMPAAQARPVLDRAVYQGDGRSSSFRSHPLDVEMLLHFTPFIARASAP
jgi:hypothetical protein